MFNKSYNQVSAECEMLNQKLRGHLGGKLNSSTRVDQLDADSSSNSDMSWTNLMICAAFIAVYFLIRGIFTK